MPVLDTKEDSYGIETWKNRENIFHINLLKFMFKNHRVNLFYIRNK